MTDKNTEHLQLLRIFHFVLGGMTLLFSLFPVIHLVIGIAILSGAFEGNGNNPPPPIFGLMFTIMPLLFIIIGMTIGSLQIAAGINIGKRTKYKLCFVVACIECMMMPLGTVLGVFTIILLNKEEVRSQFGIPHK